MTIAEPIKRERKSHIWARADDEWYVEPEWVSARLFEVEPFEGAVWDPACGSGRICESARAVRHTILYSDIVDRGYRGGPRPTAPLLVRDFLEMSNRVDNIVTNPPFDIARQFAEQACRLVLRKAAIVFPTARLNAARWLQDLPLRRVWLLTPRPSMPPGRVIAAGEKPQGGKMDFCWLVFGPGHGAPEIRWLNRDKTASEYERVMGEGEGGE